MKYILITLAGILLMVSTAFAQSFGEGAVRDCQEKYLVWIHDDPEHPTWAHGNITDRLAYNLCSLKDPLSHLNYELTRDLSQALDEVKEGPDPDAVLAKYGTSVKEVADMIDKMRVRKAQRDYGQFYWDLKRYGSSDPQLGWALDDLFIGYTRALTDVTPETSPWEAFRSAAEDEFIALDKKLGFIYPTGIRSAFLCAMNYSLDGQVIANVVAECKLDELPAPTWAEFDRWCSGDYARVLKCSKDVDLQRRQIPTRI